MITRTHGLRAAFVAVAALGWWTGANAQGTLAGTQINNRATVSYSVGSIPQAVIESSPTGNVTPGPNGGADTAFLVDNRVNLSVTELSTNATVVTPGVTNAAVAFRVVNLGNAPEGYRLTMAEQVGTLLFGNTDNANFNNLVIRVDEDPSGGNGTGNGSYDGTESATSIDLLNPSQDIIVFVVSPTVPLTLINNNFANVNLQAQTAVPGTAGGTLEVASPPGNLPNVVELLFVDGGNDATENATDQFAVVSAGLRITKAETILDDPFASATPRALPGSHVEYLITIENTSTTTAANGVSLSDPVPANTSLFAGQYAGKDVAITGGSTPTCTADAIDGDGDGCGIDGLGALTVSTGVLGNIAASATVTVRFRVTIL
ncbi:MAG TPA: hypothetical protein VNP02_03555 [Gammaproteobacteria bacterium]|nr:hypothetical protein [Gammaproteobacteria bacterium]